MWQISPDLTDSGLQQLTALQQLEDLCIHGTGLSEGVLTASVGLDLGKLELTAAPKVQSGCCCCSCCGAAVVRPLLLLL
jgi:hypothetical protein